MKFEAHITINREDYEKARDAVAAVGAEDKWKVSRIDGDPVMGDKVFAYLTGYDTNYEVMLRRLRAAIEFLRGYDVPVLREKIELIMHDVRHDTQ